MHTGRLELAALNENDADFIIHLVNSPGWIRFIGERNVHTTEDAYAYIQRILDNSGVRYLVVRLKSNLVAIGIITIIKREYLEHHDIGFAFLPEYSGKGYAYEASVAVLKSMLESSKHPVVLGTTKQDNMDSIRLLEKLGLNYKEEIQVAGDKLMLFSTIDLS